MLAAQLSNLANDVIQESSRVSSSDARKQNHISPQRYQLQNKIDNNNFVNEDDDDDEDVKNNNKVNKPQLQSKDGNKPDQIINEYSNVIVNEQPNKYKNGHTKGSPKSNKSPLQHVAEIYIDDGDDDEDLMHCSDGTLLINSKAMFVYSMSSK